jgi:hypothetical protein
VWRFARRVDRVRIIDMASHGTCARAHTPKEGEGSVRFLANNIEVIYFARDQRPSFLAFICRRRRPPPATVATAMPRAGGGERVAGAQLDAFRENSEGARPDPTLPRVDEEEAPVTPEILSPNMSQQNR